MNQNNSFTTFNAKEIDDILINPYSGLVNYGIENSYGNYLRKIPEYIYPEAIVYLRASWGDLEPEEGELHLEEFEKIKDTHLQNGALQWSFRIGTALSNLNVSKHPTPEWAIKAGAKVNRAKRGYTEPQYGNLVYQEKYGNFIRRLAKRYDGDPKLAFIDISGLGLYGEWGDPETPQDGWEDVERRENDAINIIDIYLKAFKKTHLAISTHIIDSLGRSKYGVAYALKKGAWVRRDGVGSPFFHEGHKELVNQYWHDRPVVTELYAMYSAYNEVETGRNKNHTGWSYTDAMDQVLDQHGMCAEMSRDLDVTDTSMQHPKFNVVAKQVGYRLVLSKVLFPSVINQGEKLILRQLWKNQGVSKLYVKHPLRVYLINSIGEDVWSAVDNNFDSTNWCRGNVYEVFSSFTVWNVPSGSYELRIALINHQGEPTILLGMDGDDGEKRYSIGKLEVCGEPCSVVGSQLELNFARAQDAIAHVAVVNENRPVHYVAPINDGLLRVSIDDAPGDLSTVRQGYGVIWEKDYTFNTFVYYAGDTIKGEGGWFEREFGLEVFDGEKWESVNLVYWDKVYSYNYSAANQRYTAAFNRVSAKGVRVSGITGRRESKWVSVCEVEVFLRT